MSQKWFNNIDLQQNELQNGVIQNLEGDPSNGRAGQIYYNTTDKGYRYHNGTAWVSITAQAVKSIKAGDGLTSSGTDTVTINLGTPSTSGAASGTTYGSNGVTDTSHTHQVRISAATTDTPGVIELATDAEAETGTDTTRAINAKQLAAAKQSAINSAKVTIQTSNGITGGSTTPGNSFALSGVDALTTAKGVVQLATQDEVNTGTDAKKVITPATLRKGKASGVASLDANSKIITSQLPDYLLGQVMYGGNASTVATTTTISPSDSLKTKKNITTTSISIVNSATSTAANTYGYKDMEGVYFICQAKGTFAETSFEKGDWIISTGAKWEKIDNTDAVKSVNGQIGDVKITRVDEAGTADKLKTARTIALKGDATGSTTFDGSANKDINVTLANTGVTAGTYNNVTVDAKGRVVSASNIKTSVVSEITGNGTQKEFNITHSLGKNVIVQVFLNGQQIGSDTADELVGVDVYTTSEKVKLVFATAPSTSQKFKVVISSGGNGVESLTPTADNDGMVPIADSTAATGWKFGEVPRIKLNGTTTTSPRFWASTDGINIAIGENAKSMNKAIAIGENADGSKEAVVIGRNATNGNASTGQYGEYSVIIGDSCNETAETGYTGRNIVIGRNCRAKRNYSIIMGDAIDSTTQSAVTYIGGAGWRESGRALMLGVATTNFTYMNAAGSSWTSASDIRDKTDIEEIEHALDFIEKLKPITYVMNDRERYLIKDKNGTPILDENGKQQYDVEAHKRGEKKKHRRFAGLSAQDTYQAMLDCYNNNANYAQIVDNNKFDHPDDEYIEQYCMSYERLVPFLIKAMQEQQEQIEQLKAALNK